jgi:hypothetical protein
MSGLKWLLDGGGVRWLGGLFGSQETKRLTALEQGQETLPDFDPDAALARYLESKAANPATAPLPPSPGGFGRKGA